MLEVARADDATCALMTRVLRGRPGLDAEYPTVFGADARGRVVRSVEDGRVVSACAILVRDLRCAEGSVRVGLIGSVATAEDRRRRGLAAAVLQRAEAELARAGCLASLLWADDEAFYAARGYARVGAEEDFLLERGLRWQLPDPVGVRDARPDDARRLHGLYRRHVQRSLRSSRESASLFAGPGMRVFIHEGPDGVDAYACLGRGGDLVSVIHEWGGDTDATLACLAAALDAATGDEPLYLIAPLDEAPDGLPARLRAMGVASAPGVLAMGRLLDPRGALERLVAASGGELARRDADDDAGRRLDGPRGSLRLDDGELLACVLGAGGGRAAQERVEARTGATLADLPLRPFLWGLDSI